MAKRHRVLRIDLAKQISHVLGLDETGKIVLRKRFTWQTLLPFVMQLPPVLIGVEVCAAAHSTR
jgi:transposase